ncbi:MAG: ATP-dependent zinc metalloprotease FtsH [candidate division FCPU426 bacterium]
MGNNAFKTIAFWMFMVVLMMLVFSYVNPRVPVKDKNPNYSEFLALVDAHKIESVEVMPFNQGYTIKGELKEDKSKFELMAPFGDQELFNILRKSGVSMKVKPLESTGWEKFWNILGQFGPILVLIVFWFFMLNRMQGGGPGGAMAFGKSKAKMLQGSQGKVTFADVAGVDEAKEELTEIIDFLKDPGKYQKLGGKIPKGVLLLGPPGTGKTLLARAVAGEAGRPFFSISGSDFVEMFVGVGASRVRDLFDQGKKNAPCIIFIDEIDAVGRHRGAGLGGGHDEREQTLNAMLVEMDGFEANTGVILMAATNRPDVLDPALIRPGRFDRQVTVDRPDLGGREAILKVHSKNVILGPDIDMRVIAHRTSGFSGADLANLVNEGALLAARRGKKAVTMDDLTEAIDRIFAGPQRRSRIMTEKEKKSTAYHEAGHALVGRMQPHSDPIQKISIIPRGYAMLGYTMSSPKEDRFTRNQDELEADLAMTMGGRAAEKITFAELSTGASNDLEQATKLARNMVTKFGMSSKVGSVSFSGGQEVFIGRDWGKERNYSEKTAETIDSEVRRLVEEAEKKALTLLHRHRKTLDKLAKILLEKEVVEGYELDELLGLKPKESPKPGKGSSAVVAPSPA